MKYVKRLGIAALAAGALMAFLGAGTASATQLTGAGGTVLGVGTTISSEAEGKIALHPPFGTLECEGSSMSGELSNAGGATSTPKWLILIFKWGPCPWTFHLIAAGILEIHTKNATPDNRATLTWTGLSFTTVYLGFHCVFGTNNTNIGTLTGSGVTGATATIDIEATIPRTGGSSGAFCGSTAQWTGSYKISSPDVLNVH